MAANVILLGWGANSAHLARFEGQFVAGKRGKKKKKRKRERRKGMGESTPK